MKRLSAQTKELLADCLSGKLSKTDTARRLSISRKTLYQWIDNYQGQITFEGEKEPNNRAKENDILRIIVANPTFGPKKIAKELKKRSKVTSQSSVYKYLRANSLNSIKEREAYARKYRKAYQAKDPVCPGHLRLRSDVRKDMVEEVLVSGRKAGEVCRKYAVSRKTYAKWKRRYLEARQKGEWMLNKMADQHPMGSDHPNGAGEDTVRAVLEVVANQPELSVHKISKQVKFIGHHGIQNILEREGLSKLDERRAYSLGRRQEQKQAEKPVYQPASLLNKAKSVLASFTPDKAPAPPPTIYTIAKSFAASFATVFIVTYGFAYYATLLTSHTFSQSIGLVFATFALLMGTFFFLYSLKYYITLALVLSFSQKEGEEYGNGNGKTKNFINWILGNGNGNTNGNGKDASARGLDPDLSSVKLERYPFISIHIPFYNEKNVVERSMAAATNFDYKGEYEVVLCDDSTDETTQIIRDYQKRHLAKGESLNIVRGEGWELTKVEVKPGVYLKHLHRTKRSGFKGAALKLALTLVDPRTEFVSVFDADFVPYPDTLYLFLKYFKASAGTTDFRGNKKVSNIAAVQGYQWHVLNKSENWVTRGVRSEYAGSYVIERSGTELYGGLKQISGSVYMIRRDALEEVGWETSITEDFELTLKLYNAGYKVVYTPYIQAPAECVSTVKRLIRQRMRWAEGHSFNVKKMMGKLFTNPNLTRSEKFEFAYLIPYYLQAFFFLAGTLSWLLAETVFRVNLPFWTALWGWSLVLTNMIALPLMNAVGIFLEEGEEKDYVGLGSFVALSYIVVPFQAYAAVKGFFEDEEGGWFRTPKTGRITDVLSRGRFMRLIEGILPGGGVNKMSKVAHDASFSPYLNLSTAHNTFDEFNILPRRGKHTKLIGRSLITVMLLATTALNMAAPYIPVRQMEQVPAGSGVILSPEQERALDEAIKNSNSDKQSLNLGLIKEVNASDTLVDNDTQFEIETGGLKLKGEKTTFEIGEDPSFTLDVEEPSSAPLGMFIKRMARMNVLTWEERINVKLIDSHGFEYRAATVKALTDKKFAIEIDTDSGLRPGEYSLIVQDDRGNGLVQDFSWGVLAINTNKPLYAPGETAQISMAVLNETGDMVCDAALTLQITDPAAKATVMSTEDGTIVVSDTCGVYGYTDEPDYFANYEVGGEGEYKMVLMAETGNGEYAIDDTFTVQEKIDFDIERYTATRIYPPLEYPVHIKVTPKHDFSGVITEKVPLAFDIGSTGVKTASGDDTDFDLPQEDTAFVAHGDGAYLIRWEVENWKAGETYILSYTYKAPIQSPDFYQIGPLTFVSFDDLYTFKEARAWQVAIDATETRYMRGDQHTVNSLTAYDLDLSQSSTAQNTQIETAGSASSGGNTVTWGIRVWKRTSGGTESEITSGTPVAQVTRSSAGSGLQNNTWAPGSTSMNSTDSIVVRVYAQITGSESVSWTQQAQHTTEQIGAYTIDNATWTVYYYTTYATNTGGSPSTRYTRGNFYWGTTTYNSRITNFQWSLPPNASPTLNVDQPDGVNDTIAKDANFTVQYDLADTDNVVTADFYYDTNNSGLDGTAIAGCQDQPEGTNATCTWNTTGVTPGTYYVYGITSDGVNPQVSDYSSGVVTIKDPPTLNIDQPDGVSDVVTVGDSYNIQYDLADTDDIVTVDFYYDSDGSGLDGTAITGCQDQVEGTNVTCSWDTTGMTPGIYYVYGITTDNVNPQVSAYSPGQITIDSLSLQVTGTCRNYDDSADCSDDGSNEIRVAFNGVLQAQSDTTVDGSFFISGLSFPSAGTVITVFINGESNADERAAAVTTYSTGNVAVELYHRHLTIGSNQNTTVTNADLASYDYSASGNDTDVIFEVDANNDLTVDNLGNYSDEKLLVLAGNTYRPDSSSSGNITTTDLVIEGTVYPDVNSLYIYGDWEDNGVYVRQLATVNFLATSGSPTIKNGDIYEAIINDSGNDTTWTLLSNFFVAYMNNVSGTLDVNETGNYTIEVAGEWTNSGTFLARQGETIFNTEGEISASGNMTGTSSFYDLTFDNGNSNGTVSFSDDVDVSGDFHIVEGTTVEAPTGNLAVAGNFTNDSSFTPGTGTVYLNGSGDQEIRGPVTFNNLTATSSVNRILKFEASTTFTVNGNLSLQGGDCQNLLFLRSLTDNTAFTINHNTGGTNTLSYLDIQDSTWTNAITISNSVDSGGNSNATISASGCIGGSTTNANATGYSFQRKTFYDDVNLRYWLFYHDGDEIEVRYSTDATTWNVASILSYDTNDFSVWWEQIGTTEYVWLAVRDGNSINVIRGSLGTSSITWDGGAPTPTEVTAFTGTGSSDDYSYPYLSLDSSDYIWVGARYYDGTNYIYKAVRSDDTDTGGIATWSNVGFGTTIEAKQITTTQTDANVYGNIVPLTSQNMYATFAEGTALKGCKWVASSTQWQDGNGDSCERTEGGSGGATWYTSGSDEWTDRNKITIKGDQVSGTTDLSNFPVLINSTFVDWKTTANGGKVGQSDGGDILFTASNGTTKLDHEIEKYTATTGELVVWVKIPTLDADANTEIYIYYGNTTVADQWNTTAVWGSSYLMVHHLEETTTGATDFKDSTSNAYDSDSVTIDGTGSNANATGKIDGAVEFDGSNDNIVVNSFSIPNKGSVSFWIQPTLNSTRRRVMGTADNYEIVLEATNVISNQMGASGSDALNSTITLTSGQMYYVVMNYDTTTNAMEIYIDGIQRGSSSQADDNPASTANLTIGTRTGSTEYFDGILDDMVIMNNTKGSDWIVTEYNNQSSPSTFYEVSGVSVKIDDASNFGPLDSANRQILRTSNGLLYAVVQASSTEIEILKSLDSGNSWAIKATKTITADNYISSNIVAAAVDSADTVHIAYFEGAGPGVDYVKYDTYNTSTDSFTGSNTTVMTIGTSLAVAIAIDSSDMPHIVASANSTNGIFYDNKVGGSWGTDITISSNVSDSLDLAISEDNYPEIIYIDSTSDDLTIASADRNDPTLIDHFTVHDIDDTVNDVTGQHGTSIAIDSAGNTWVAYVDENGTNDYVSLAYHPDGSAWTSDWTTAITNSNVGHEPSIAINGTDIYVFYQDDQNDIVYDVYDGSSWSGETVLQAHGTLKDAKARWSFINNYDSTGTAPRQTNTYYFNTSDAGPTDPDSKWTNDSNAFDGSSGTYAYTTSSGSTTLNYLQGDGTNSPTSGGTITSVKARVYGCINISAVSFQTLDAAIYTDGLGELLGTATKSLNFSSCSADWSNYTTLSSPASGWSWEAISSLEVKAYANGGALNQAQIYKVEILVESTNDTSQNEIDYIYSDGTDVWYSSLSLGGGSVASDGMQDSVGTLYANTLTANFSTVSDASGNVHIAYADSGTYEQLSYKTWNGTSWGSEIQVDTSELGGYVSISLDTDTNDIYVVWKDNEHPTGYLYYRQYDADNGGFTNTTRQTLADSGTNTNLTTNYSGATRIFGMWTVSSGSAYAVNFGLILVPEKLWLLICLAPIIPLLSKKKGEKSLFNKIKKFLFSGSNILNKT